MRCLTLRSDLERQVYDNLDCHLIGSKSFKLCVVFKNEMLLNDLADI